MITPPSDWEFFVASCCGLVGLAFTLYGAMLVGMWWERRQKVKRMKGNVNGRV